MPSADDGSAGQPDEPDITAVEEAELRKFPASMNQSAEDEYELYLRGEDDSTLIELTEKQYSHAKKVVDGAVENRANADTTPDSSDEESETGSGRSTDAPVRVVGSGDDTCPACEGLADPIKEMCPGGDEPCGLKNDAPSATEKWRCPECGHHAPFPADPTPPTQAAWHCIICGGEMELVEQNDAPDTSTDDGEREEPPEIDITELFSPRGLIEVVSGYTKMGSGVHRAEGVEEVPAFTADQMNDAYIIGWRDGRNADEAGVDGPEPAAWIWTAANEEGEIIIEVERHRVNIPDYADTAEPLFTGEQVAAVPERMKITAGSEWNDEYISGYNDALADMRERLRGEAAELDRGEQE